MPTLGNIVHAVRHRLTGAGTTSDNVSELVEPVDASGLVFKVDDAKNGARQGVYEIGLEKVRVKKVDTGTATLTAYSFGRGYDGTTPAAHPAGSEVVHAPAFPASTVAAECNGLLHELYPSVYAVKQHEATYTVPFTLPTDAVGVIRVYRQGPGGQGWVVSDRWGFDVNAGHGLRVKHLTLGETVRVVYAARPAVFDLSDPNVLTQDFETVTGLDARLSDLMSLGVAYRLSPFFDMARLPATGSAPRADAQSKPPGQGGTVSRLLLAEFTARLQQEQQVLANENPIRIHREA